jgi:outer membrane protein assembly factor BamA
LRYVCLILLNIIFLSLAAQENIFHIKGIKISGNHRTKDIVFLREIGKEIGDTIQNFTTIAQIYQKRISSLGLFNLVNVRLESDTIFIDVKERIYIWAMPRLLWADRNFNVWYQTKDPSRLIYGATAYFNNLNGLNHNLAITVINGYNHAYEIVYNYPFSYHNHGWAFSGKAGYWNNHELWYKTENDKLKFLRTDINRIQQNYSLLFTEKKRFNYFSRLEISEGFYRNEIDSAASLSNLNYLMKGNKQNEFFVNLEYVSDHRNQRDYPTSGYLLRAGFRNALVKAADSSVYVPTVYFRYTHFKPVGQKYGLALGLFSKFTPVSLPYNMGRQLGYQSDYVRGYEPYVADGSGFVLTKVAFRRMLLNNQVLNLGNNKPLKNYRKIPFSIWFNIFADAGRVLKPSVVVTNSLNQKWQGGIGVGLDIIAWYSAMTRIEYSINAMGKGFFNLAFKNAF